MQNAHGRTCKRIKYISIYISLCMKTFLKTGVYIYIYIYILVGVHDSREGDYLGEADISNVINCSHWKSCPRYLVLLSHNSQNALVTCIFSASGVESSLISFA